MRFVQFAIAVVLVDAAFSPLFAQQDAAAPTVNRTAAPAEDWQREFDSICAKTTDAMTLTAAELRSLVQRSDALQPKIEKLDDTRRKVYSRRLQQCRGLYAYVLESKSADAKAGSRKSDERSAESKNEKTDAKGEAKNEKK